MFEQFELLCVPEAAVMLRISSAMVYSLIREGKIVGFKTGRSWKIPKQSVLDYIKLQKLNHAP